MPPRRNTGKSPRSTRPWRRCIKRWPRRPSKHATTSVQEGASPSRFPSERRQKEKGMSETRRERRRAHFLIGLLTLFVGPALALPASGVADEGKSPPYVR